MRFIRGQGSGVLAKSRNYETAAALPDNPANPVFWPSFALLAIAVASIAAPLLWHLSCFWQIDPQYSYGWIVPVLSVYLAWRRWKSRPAAEPAPSGTTICLAA